MSAPVPESPVLERSPEEGQHSGHEHVLAQLSAALENPDIKALEWSEDGRGVLVHTELYEEEMRRNTDLFPELAALGCVMALQAQLLARGFTLGAKANTQVLLLQHPDFQRAQPTTEEPGTLGSNASLSAKQQKKKKKKRYTRRLCRPRGATSQDTLGRLPRLRPLYQYINLGMPELMHPAAEDEVPELAQPSQVPEAPGMAAAPHLQGGWTSSAVGTPAPGVDDKSMQVDIDRMLRYAAHLVPHLFPQYK